MAKVAKETAFLVSSGGTAFHYCNRKNKKKFKGEGKLKLKKYDPVLRKHVLFEEKKLSKLKKQVKKGPAAGAAAEAAKPVEAAPKKAKGEKKPAAEAAA